MGVVVGGLRKRILEGAQESVRRTVRRVGGGGKNMKGTRIVNMSDDVTAIGSMKAQIGTANGIDQIVIVARRKMVGTVDGNVIEIGTETGIGTMMIVTVNGGAVTGTVNGIE